MITIVIKIKMEKRKKNIPLMIKKNNGHQNPLPPSPKEKLELGKVLKVEIGESG